MKRRVERNEKGKEEFSVVLKHFIGGDIVRMWIEGAERVKNEHAEMRLLGSELIRVECRVEMENGRSVLVVEISNWSDNYILVNKRDFMLSIECEELVKEKVKGSKWRVGTGKRVVWIRRASYALLAPARRTLDEIYCSP